MNFGAVLIISFGGPGGPQDIRPFLANVLRGRRVSPERVEEVAHHYELFGGLSPITDLTRRQARGLQELLQRRGRDLPVYVGMRNWHPYLADTLETMAEHGVRRAIGFITSAHHSYSGCGQYRQNVIDARKELAARGHGDIEIHYVDSWYDHPLFIQSFSEHVREAEARLAPELCGKARLIFTAHSIPMPMAENCRYVEQLSTTARLVADSLGRTDWALVYQSRSGRPQDPWLEPDICDYLRTERGKGLASAVIIPIGFVCDHIEVLYDLDHEAAELGRALDLPMARASAPNADPLFLKMMADVVLRKDSQHTCSAPLRIAGDYDSPAKTHAS
jgi:ferrochelatase